MKPVSWVLLLNVTAGVATSATSAPRHACEKIVGLLATEFVYRVPNTELARVEIRQCNPEGSGKLQLVAWRSRDLTPALIVDTDDFGIVQTATRGSVFVIETGGATTDQVFVISYARGQPSLVLRRVTKGTARINMERGAVNLVIDGIYAGDSPPRTETHHFASDVNELSAR